MSSDSLALRRNSPSALWRTWLPPFAWLVLISICSTDVASSQHTGSILMWLLSALHVHGVPAEMLNALARKLAHFSIYGIFSLLLFRAWRTTLPQPFRVRADAYYRDDPRPRPLVRWAEPLWTARWSSLAVAMTAAAAALDEFHQGFVVSRTSSPIDVAIDLGGALFVNLVLMVIYIGRTRSAN